MIGDLRFALRHEPLDLGLTYWALRTKLITRMRAVLRRSGSSMEEPDPAGFIAGELHIDFAHRIVMMARSEIHLTPIEYDLLRYLGQNSGRVLTHQQLLTRMWGVEYAEDTRTLRVHIVHLRNKLEADPTNPRYIHTETRIGYRFRYSP